MTTTGDVISVAMSRQDGARAAACKALEGAMNIEATALGVDQLLDEFRG